MNLKTDKKTKKESLVNKKKLPLFSKISYILAAICAMLFLIFILSEKFSDFFNLHIASILRAALAYITGWIPFSLAEMLFIMIPAITVFTVMFAMKHYADSWRDVLRFCAILISVASLLFSTFTLSFASAYRGTSLDKKLNIERNDVSADELYETALILANELNLESDNIVFQSNGFSIMPYGRGEMNDKLIDAYSVACEKYSFIQRLDSNIKPVMLSGLLSYTHITGIYSFFTGEANINTAFPDYTVPYTAAHELAHQRGIAKEDEANFVAFLVCMESEDAYIRYSAYLNLYEYVSSALYSADVELYRKVNSELDIDVRYEMSAYSKFFEKYEESVASEVTETVNNTFLVIQGTEGTKSYGMVVDLAVAYYKSR